MIDDLALPASAHDGSLVASHHVRAVPRTTSLRLAAGSQAPITRTYGAALDTLMLAVLNDFLMGENIGADRANPERAAPTRTTIAR